MDATLPNVAAASTPGAPPDRPIGWLATATERLAGAPGSPATNAGWNPPPAGSAPPPPTSSWPPPTPPPPTPPGAGSADRGPDGTGGDDGDADRSRTGAIWVTGAGAFLLLAAAAVFVAVRWERLGNEVKLAILGALTGGFLLAGRRVRRELPATGGVLFHLGALLVPLDAAAVAIHTEMAWDESVFLVGATATVAWFLLERAAPSSILRWAAAAAVVVTAAGGAAVAGVPTALVLAAAALAAQQLRAPKPALGWATVAGLGPLMVFAEAWISRSEASVLLGLAPGAPSVAWLVSGALAAFVIGREAHRRLEPVLVVPAFASLAIGAAATWTAIDPTGAIDLVGAATAFLLIELVAHLVRRDPFWQGPARVAATTGEVVTAIASPLVLAATAWWFVDPGSLDAHRTGVGTAALVATAAWAIADIRRIAGTPTRRGTGWSIAVGSGWWPATVAIVGSLLVAVGLLTGSPLALGVAAVGLAAGLVATGRPGGHAMAVALAAAAPLVAGYDLLGLAPSASIWSGAGGGTSHLVSLTCVAVLGLGGAVTVACAAVVRARMADPAQNRPYAWLLAGAALAPIATATAVLVDVEPTVRFAGAAVAAWCVALVLDQARTRPAARRAEAGPTVEPDAGRGIDVPLGATARAGSLLVLTGAGLMGARGTMAVAALLTVAFVVDALRTRVDGYLLGVAITLPVLVAALGADLDLTMGETGLALTMLAAVAAGAHLLIGDARGWPLLGLVVSSGAAGFGLSATETTTGWLGVLALAGIGMAYAAVHRSVLGGSMCAVAATVATWGLLVDARVEAIDAYLAPVALVLVVAGVLARRSAPLSSWVAYGPAIVLLGGGALVERLAGGGGGIHALVAGAVATGAILVGGARRLAGPLLLGTVLVVVLTVHESLTVTRQVPTWGWLALGGATLVGAGIVMERRDTSPMETGRRLVDVVGTHFH